MGDTSRKGGKQQMKEGPIAKKNRQPETRRPNGRNLAKGKTLSAKMPFKAVQAPKCPKCGKSVYANEERLAGGQKWHVGCFACSVCNKMLDSTNLQDKDGVLYCKTCHSREFGPKGYGYGVG